ncbi:hypothetical protein V8B97DRAFT_1854355, partial [Scleroderma yunnanense]
GHTPLNHHLSQMHKVNSPTCLKCGALSETTHHFLLIFQAYHSTRRTLEQKIGRKGMSLKHLLTNNESLSHLFRFIMSTDRLNQTFEDLNP